jgi:hypothetical protein
MHHVRQENLPFVGRSHEFVGTEHGNTGVSVFFSFRRAVRNGAEMILPELTANRKSGLEYIKR